jgi:hypothetical protein
LNRYVLLRTRDFKSRASASFATRAGMKVLKILHQLMIVVLLGMVFATKRD